MADPEGMAQCGPFDWHTTIPSNEGDLFWWKRPVALL